MKEGKAPRTMTHLSLLLLLPLLLLAAARADAATLPDPPGPSYTPPERPAHPEAPLIYSHTTDAGPDESFLLVGERLTREVVAWGAHPDALGGREVRPDVQLLDEANGLLIATLPQRTYDGPFVVWVRNDAGWSEPVVFNRPQAWWASPDPAAAGSRVRIFGRNLARRPHFARAFAWLVAPEGQAARLKVLRAGKYELEVQLPDDLSPSEHQFWVHAGKGGAFGWSDPLSLHVTTPAAQDERPTEMVRDGDVQAAVNAMAERGGGDVVLPEGTFRTGGTLTVPANVTVRGAGAGRTVLQTPADPSVSFARIHGSGWNQGPGRVHTPGDTMTYQVEFPQEGTWHVWVRYATEMSKWDKPGVSKCMSLSVHGAKPVFLDHLPNTGSFGTFQWSRSATLPIPAGMHEVVWRNEKGGGINLDAFVFALDPDYEPSDAEMPTSGERIVVVQGEDVSSFKTTEGVLPGGDAAAVWLAGDGAALTDLTLCGSPRTNLGVVVRSPDHPAWLSGCRLERVVVRDVEGKQSENCGVRLYNADHVTVRDCELWGRAPIFLSGVRQGRVVGNRLVAASLWGGNAEGYILGRNDIIRECIIEDNVCACPPGAEAGGPTGRRLIWVSTGHGSVDLNWMANNREDRARFGGVAGTGQNVGEMILFEANERYAYYGPPARADEQSITLPATVPPTPDERLGNVARDQLAHDADGNETPFWPPDADDGGPEPPVTEYFVTVLQGRGMGQTRRVTGRQDTTYRLDRPWRVAPDDHSLIVVHTAFYRNHIVGNRCVDGMTGIQLWITCIENIVSGNEVARQRKPGLYLYGNCTTLASSMPRTWNRGIGPLYFNHIEGTRCDETSCGALLTSGERGHLPVEFPRCLGNVLRHNSFVRSRTSGVLLTGNRPADEEQPTSAILGTVVEFNVVRDAQTAYRVARSAEYTLLRRNHAYFWYPVSPDPQRPIAFQIEDADTAAVIEQNSVEGIHGTPTQRIIKTQRGRREEPGN